MSIDRFKRIGEIIITIGILLVLIYLISKNLNEIKEHRFNVNIIYLVPAFILLLASLFLLPILWYLITNVLKCNLRFFQTIRIRFISEIGKYIPGRILGYGYLMLQYNEAGKDKIRVLNSTIYELYLSTFSAFLFFTLILMFTSFQILDNFKTGFIVIAILGIISLHPWFFQKLSDIICKIFKKDKIQYQIKFTKIIFLLALYQAFWIILSLAFYFFVKAFTEIDFTQIGYLSGSFAISTFAGFMAFFLPAGLGAREGLLIYLLGFTTGNPLAILISIGSRLWLILTDSILFLIALLLGVLLKK